MKQQIPLMPLTIRRWFWIIEIIILTIVFISCITTNSRNFPNVEGMLCSPKPTIPILTEADAICFAVYVDSVADVLRAAQIQARYEGWTVTVHRKEDFKGWEVLIHSKGRILPAYICKLSFTESGSLLDSCPQCGYKK